MRALATAGLLVAFALSALAADVKKKDGTVVAGEITSEDDEGVTLKNRLGEARIAKSEIESIDRGASQSVEERLEKIKAETIERLKALADAATSEKRKDAAQSIRDTIDDVRRWSIRPSDAKPVEESAISFPAPPEPRAVDFVDVLRKWEKLKADSRTTSVARDQFCSEMNRRPARVFMKVIDVVKNGNGYTVNGTANGFTIVATFEEPADLARLVKLKPGMSISCGGTMRFEGTTDLWACRLK